MSVALFCYTAVLVPHFVITQSFFPRNCCTVFSILAPFLHTKKVHNVVSDSPRLVDFVMGQLNPVFFSEIYGEFKLQKNCNQCSSNFF